MSRYSLLSAFLFLLSCLSSTAWAEDRLRLETTIIKGNKEMPQILYVVPWQDMKRTGQREQVLQIHSLYGDIFDPVTPDVLHISPEAGFNQSEQ